MVLEFVVGDELAAPPVAGHEPFDADVLLVDLLPRPRFLVAHLLVGDLRPLLLAHARAAAQQARHDPFDARLLLVERLLPADDAPLAAAPLADDVALVLAPCGFVQQS